MNRQSKRTKTRRVGEEAVIIGRNLKTIRLAKGYSQRHIATALGTSFQQVQKYEKGQNRIPAEKLHLMKRFFDVPYECFFKDMVT